MSAKTAEQFVAALGKLERERDLETIAALFAEDAEFNKPPAKDWWNGEDTGSVVKTKVTSLATLALTL